MKMMTRLEQGELISLTSLLGEKKDSNNSCNNKLILYSNGETPIQILSGCPWDYIDDSRFDTITAITFSSSLSTTLKLLKRFTYLNLYIGLTDDYNQMNIALYNSVFSKENEELTNEITNTLESGQKVSLYKIKGSHAKIYFLSNSNVPSEKRVILSSANLSDIAFRGNQIEHFTVFDDENMYREIYNFFETQIKPRSEFIINSDEIVRDIIQRAKKEKVININLVSDNTEIKNGLNINIKDKEMKEEIAKEIVKREEIVREILKKEEIVKEIAKAVVEEKVYVNMAEKIFHRNNSIENHINYPEKMINEIKRTTDELIKKRNLPLAKFKEEVHRVFNNIKQEKQEEKAFLPRYTYDVEKQRFVITGMEEVKYNMDLIKRDVEILNKFIEAYSTPNDELDNERLWIVSSVLLYSFSSFYMFFLRYLFKEKGQEVFQFEVAPTFCLLVGTANSGKTLLLTLISKLFDRDIVKYGNIQKVSNSKSYIIPMYFNSKDLTPYLVDEVKPSDIRDDKGFGDMIKNYSNNPFANNIGLTPQGSMLLTANLEQFNSESQITRRVLFFHFKSAVKDQRLFKNRIVSTEFNNLSYELTQYYIFWLNENMDYILERLNTIASKTDATIKDTYTVAYEFLKSVGVNVSMEFPDFFGTYEYFIRKAWRDLYRYHQNEIFIEKDDKFLVERSKIENYIKPSPYFNIEEASTTEKFIFDKKKFLDFIDFGVKIDPKYLKTDQKNGIFGWLKKIANSLR